MKKSCIGATYHETRGMWCESWQGGGIDDVAFRQRYDEGFEIGHSCQDEEDRDIFHYAFQKVGSKSLESCVWCGTEFSLDPEALRTDNHSREILTMRLAPETKDTLDQWVAHGKELEGFKATRGAK